MGKVPEVDMISVWFKPNYALLESNQNLNHLYGFGFGFGSGLRNSGTENADSDSRNLINK